MAGPQLENGFTRIANEIMEEILKIKFSATQLKILLVIWRYTYGFQRKKYYFSLSFLEEATNTSKRHIRTELKKLIEMKIITVEKEATFDKPRVLSFNKYHDTWILPQRMKTSSVDEKGVAQGMNTSLLQRMKTSSKKERSKETKEKTSLFLFPFSPDQRKESGFNLNADQVKTDMVNGPLSFSPDQDKESKFSLNADQAEPESNIQKKRMRYTNEQLKIIDEFFDILCWTRRSGKLADSVILRIYKQFEKYRTEVVIHALQIYINNPKYHDKKENYVIGIMRNTKMEDVVQGQQADNSLGVGRKKEEAAWMEFFQKRKKAN